MSVFIASRTAAPSFPRGAFFIRAVFSSMVAFTVAIVVSTSFLTSSFLTAASAAALFASANVASSLSEIGPNFLNNFDF